MTCTANNYKDHNQVSLSGSVNGNELYFLKKQANDLLSTFSHGQSLDSGKMLAMKQERRCSKVKIL